MKLILSIEFTSEVSKESLEIYAIKLGGQMTTIYRNTPGVSQAFVGITAKVE
jgi:hypothetical protein